MPIRAFADESGGKGQEASVFAFAALMLPARQWAEFAEEWRLCLQAEPSIDLFKMKHASQRSREFYGFSESERDHKVRKLGQIINKHEPTVAYTVVDLDAFADTVEKADLSDDLRQPYFYAFHILIMGVAFELLEKGYQDRFEIVFDENKIFGSRAKQWYPVVRAAMEVQAPEAATLLPAEPLFRTDDEFMPLQASDLFAWSLRRSVSDLPPGPCDWVFEEFEDVPVASGSQILTRSRMEKELDMSDQVDRDRIRDVLEKVDLDTLRRLYL